jgi:signal transduction histidine kinase
MPPDAGARTLRSVSPRQSESNRIAFELHDVVAHGLSAIAIQAEAAQALLDRDPSSASAALDDIRDAAREALEDMRRLLLMSRADGDTCGRMPQPGIDELEALAARADATLTVTGPACAVPASLGLTVYRIAQEALANAGDAPAAVAVEWGENALRLEVRDGGAGPRRSVAMRERARLHGGELQAGPGRRGGYRVAATFPL